MRLRPLMAKALIAIKTGAVILLLLFRFLRRNITYVGRNEEGNLVLSQVDIGI